MQHIAAIVHGETTRQEGVGYHRSVPWWSFTKTALAAAALVLVAEGKLDLDAPIRGRSFTLHQILQHRAGLPDYGGLATYHEAVARHDPPWYLLEQVQSDAQETQPGHGWRYSNIGYLMVRTLIEETTGADMETAITRLVLAPLDIQGVKLARTPGDLQKTAWENKENYHPGWVYHGLLIGTAANAALMLHRLLTGKLLPPTLLTAMTTAHPLGGPIPGRPWQTGGYGLGLMIGTGTPSGRYIGHTGQGPRSTAAIYYCPDQDPTRTVAVFAPTPDQGSVERQAMSLAHAS